VLPSIAEVFPHDDPVARFVVAMGIAANDVDRVVKSAHVAAKNDEPWFIGLVRLATGHTFEAMVALRRWREHSPEVADFLQQLPGGVRAHLKTATGMEQRVGGGAIEHLRHRTFHYPHPGPDARGTDDELAAFLRSETAQRNEATFMIDAETAISHFGFADVAAATLAFGAHDQERFREQVRLALSGAVAFVRFFRGLMDAYAQRTDSTWGPTGRLAGRQPDTDHD
jgi:hypothetical protein